jgi:hypothetical protein
LNFVLPKPFLKPFIVIFLCQFIALHALKNSERTTTL